MREIFEKFEFEKEIEKFEETNRLFEVVKEFASIDLDPIASKSRDGLRVRETDPPL